jgi:pyrroline-5-carboxylate reductase
MTSEQAKEVMVEQFVKALVDNGCPPAKAQKISEQLADSASSMIEEFLKEESEPPHK